MPGAALLRAAKLKGQPYESFVGQLEEEKERERGTRKREAGLGQQQAIGRNNPFKATRAG